eukprot:TRINITY_DN1668_c0_g1_i1.p1 TRINITY_DN1668_c0_g1~~TRINITY_DN1668_c0_g1_i1.p1  ORF type:complete len:748 (+),score=213.61 TRINITY_DN1668_c0_g1_i1:65-2245(+)
MHDSNISKYFNDIARSPSASMMPQTSNQNMLGQQMQFHSGMNFVNANSHGQNMSQSYQSYQNQFTNQQINQGSQQMSGYPQQYFSGHFKLEGGNGAANGSNMNMFQFQYNNSHQSQSQAPMTPFAMSQNPSLHLSTPGGTNISTNPMNSMRSPSPPSAITSLSTPVFSSSFISAGNNLNNPTNNTPPQPRGINEYQSSQIPQKLQPAQHQNPQPHAQPHHQQMSSGLGGLGGFQGLKSAALDPSIQRNPSGSLAEIYQIHLTQKERIEKIRSYQKQFMNNPNKEGYDILETEHTQLKGQVEHQLKTVTKLLHQIILSPSDIHRAFFLVQVLKFQLAQIDLFVQELSSLTNPNINRIGASLIIVEDPFPGVITRGKQLDEDPIVVQLITAANVDIQSFSKVRAVIVSDNQQPQKISSNKSMIESDTQSMDMYSRILKWNMKFQSGTRKNIVSLRFAMQIQTTNSTSPVVLESQHSSPFIVITNECQWDESEGLLMKKAAYGDHNEIEWPYFANLLQKHFLRSTRQDPVRPVRPLSLSDFDYIHQKIFESQDLVCLQNFDTFWNWFGKIIQKLRYQRHICTLWQTGVIHGLITRKTVNECLIRQDRGTFLVRFSESHPGSFTIAYRTSDTSSDPDLNSQVRHYLVKPDDTAGAKKTLPDFLADQVSLVYLLQVSFSADGQPTYRKYFKDVFLDQYYSKKPPSSISGDYDDRIQVNAGGTGIGAFNEFE